VLELLKKFRFGSEWDTLYFQRLPAYRHADKFILALNSVTLNNITVFQGLSILAVPWRGSSLIASVVDNGSVIIAHNIGYSGPQLSTPFL